jgi:hypothetical protein
MEPKALEVQEKPKALWLEGIYCHPKCA